MRKAFILTFMLLTKQKYLKKKLKSNQKIKFYKLLKESQIKIYFENYTMYYRKCIVW
jgi:hypothetical protein